MENEYLKMKEEGLKKQKEEELKIKEDKQIIFRFRVSLTVSIISLIASISVLLYKIYR